MESLRGPLVNHQTKLELSQAFTLVIFFLHPKKQHLTPNQDDVCDLLTLVSRFYLKRKLHWPHSCCKVSKKTAEELGFLVATGVMPEGKLGLFFLGSTVSDVKDRLKITKLIGKISIAHISISIINYQLSISSIIHHPSSNPSFRIHPQSITK